ncbi:hypothetical protein C8R46DRAFT_462534 [Mycena filopes]|nr:hypothetical protein C8R46DRAFT_462534 [Mycena filopes]
MSILTSITDAARRAWNPKRPVSVQDIHSMLEWTWGLDYGSLASYVEPFNSDRQLANILTDKSLIVVAEPGIVKTMSLQLSESPSYHKPRTMLQNVYGSTSFNYLVLPVDPSSGILPRVVVSSVPPHVTLAPSVDHLFVHWGYGRLAFATACQSIIQHVAANPTTGRAFMPPKETFRVMKSLHERWATCPVPSRFLGLECSDEEETEAGSSTMEWEVGTLASEDEEPQRRLLPHELAADPVIKFQTYIRVEVDADDTISCDSYVTGLEGKPEELFKASMARDDDDAEWSRGIQSWAAGASDNELLCWPTTGCC